MAADRVAHAVAEAAASGTAALPATDWRHRVEQVAADAARRAEAAGANPVAACAAARMAADMYAANAERWAERQFRGTRVRHENHGDEPPAHQLFTAAGVREAVFFDCAARGCFHRVAAATRPASGLCARCERRRLTGERRVNGTRWQQRLREDCDDPAAADGRHSTAGT